MNLKLKDYQQHQYLFAHNQQLSLNFSNQMKMKLSQNCMNNIEVFYQMDPLTK